MDEVYTVVWSHRHSSPICTLKEICLKVLICTELPYIVSVCLISAKPTVTTCL